MAAARSCLLIAVLMLVSLNGCIWRKKPVPVTRPPDVSLNVSQFAGTALSGSQSRSIDDGAFAQAWGVSVRVISADAMPTADFIPAGPQARLVIGQDPSDVLAPSSQLVYATRTLWLKADDSLEEYLNRGGAWSELRTLRGAVAVGSTTSFSVGLPDGTEKSVVFARRKVRIEVSRMQAGDGYQLALASEDLVLPGLTAGQEKIVLNRSLAGGAADRVAIALPMAFPMSAAKALIVDLSLTNKADAQLAAAAKTEIAASAARVAEQIKAVPATPEEVAVAAGLAAVNSQPPSRGALMFLAEETGATLTRGVVLAADDDVLPLIVNEIRTRSQNLKKSGKATVGWMLDRATISAVSAIKEEDQGRLLPAVQGALVAYAGEVGRQLDLLQSLAAQSVNSRDLDAHIIAEHRIALEDISPALRVRAYDWLNERGQGPADYDPLGSPRARHAAIDQYNEATTQPATQPARP